jgi:hypothetical protein
VEAVAVVAEAVHGGGVGAGPEGRRCARLRAIQWTWWRRAREAGGACVE